MVAVKSQTDSWTDKGEGSLGKIVFLPFLGCLLYWIGIGTKYVAICCPILIWPLASLSGDDKDLY